MKAEEIKNWFWHDWIKDPIKVRDIPLNQLLVEIARTYSLPPHLNPPPDARPFKISTDVWWQEITAGSTVTLTYRPPPNNYGIITEIVTGAEDKTAHEDLSLVITIHNKPVIQYDFTQSQSIETNIVIPVEKTVVMVITNNATYCTHWVFMELVGYHFPQMPEMLAVQGAR